MATTLYHLLPAGVRLFQAITSKALIAYLYLRRTKDPGALNTTNQPESLVAERDVRFAHDKQFAELISLSDLDNLNVVI